MRLTKQINEKYQIAHYWSERHTFEDENKEDIAIQKLGKLEDLEEELEIDLITLFKAMMNGVYVINSDDEKTFVEPMIVFNQEATTNLYVLESVPYCPPDRLCKSFNYYLKDYGKTWALTKQELEDR